MSDKSVNLVDYIYPKMDILFLALNAPEDSNNNLHWFTHNLSFWNLLYDAGLITEKITDKLEGDEKIFGDTKINYNNWIYGVTDLDKETVETDSTKIKTTTAQVSRILNLLESNEVKKLCIMHSKVANAFLAEKLINDGYGFVGTYMHTKIFNVPFHNASIPDKQIFYALLINSDSEVLVQPDKQVVQSNTESNEILNFQSSPTSLTGVKFTFPDIDNHITENDIKTNKIRITVSFKRYFPLTSQKIILISDKKEYICSYTIRPGKSNILTLGKDLVNMLNLKAGSIIAFQKIDNGKFIIDKQR